MPVLLWLGLCIQRHSISIWPFVFFEWDCFPIYYPHRTQHPRGELLGYVVMITFCLGCSYLVVALLPCVIHEMLTHRGPYGLAHGYPGSRWDLFPMAPWDVFFPVHTRRLQCWSLAYYSTPAGGRYEFIDSFHPSVIHPIEPFSNIICSIQMWPCQQMPRVYSVLILTFFQSLGKMWSQLNINAETILKHSSRIS